MGANVPTKANLRNSLIMAQNVELKLNNPVANDDEPDETLTTMREIHYRVTHPEERFDHGRDAEYSHAKPDIELTTIMTMAKEVATVLAGRNERTSRTGILPTHTYELLLVANDDTEDVRSIRTIGMEAKLRDLEVIKPDGMGNQTVDMVCFFRVLNQEAIELGDGS